MHMTTFIVLFRSLNCCSNILCVQVRSSPSLHTFSYLLFAKYIKVCTLARDLLHCMLNELAPSVSGIKPRSFSEKIVPGKKTPQAGASLFNTFLSLHKYEVFGPIS
uniref:Secreted protein n=1 Tax=Pyxicephalus adspersus TaxID=30357 RepID=A0AAV3B303_PYXAD|nr:TPA: hypothetical protein GDO54_007191 [Pyxicephalus adspersus]